MLETWTSVCSASAVWVSAFSLRRVWRRWAKVMASMGAARGGVTVREAVRDGGFSECSNRPSRSAVYRARCGHRSESGGTRASAVVLAQYGHTQYLRHRVYRLTPGAVMHDFRLVRAVWLIRQFGRTNSGNHDMPKTQHLF